MCARATKNEPFIYPCSHPGTTVSLRLKSKKGEMGYIDVYKRQVVLGITAYYHDSSAALIVNGQIVAGALEERFSRKKHDNLSLIHILTI